MDLSTPLHRLVDAILGTTLDRTAHSVELRFSQGELLLQFYRFGIQQGTEHHAHPNLGPHLNKYVHNTLMQLDEYQNTVSRKAFTVEHDSKIYQVTYSLGEDLIRLDFARVLRPDQRE